ncbi:MAG TPA: leucyl aminopeptidase [Acidimicrobiales bacterium]|nr:leucyl aminopeptidase [Acidimicrobiales bacterium]
MPINFVAAEAVPNDAAMVAVPVFAGSVVPAVSQVKLDVAFLEGAGFEGKVGQAQSLPNGDHTLIVVGMGAPEEVDAETFRRAAAAMVGAARRTAAVSTTLLDALPGEGLESDRAARAIAEGAGMAAYEFLAYKSDATPCRLAEVTVVAPGAEASLQDCQRALDHGARVAEAVCLARDIVNEPAGGLTPTRLADVATEVAEREGLTITVLDEVAIAEEGLGGLSGVAQGSHEPARLIELRYDPPGEPLATVALVGKGVTFDSGGLSIKPADGMMTMKTDMSGAAAVLAAMSALGPLGANIRVLGFMPVTENMPGGGAIKPGDVVRIRNGRTVEVLNTDAEGRLVLADALCLAAEKRPDAIVDVATLTGAQIVALGAKISAVMGNDDGLVSQVQAAAGRAGEPVWPLPLPKEYRADIDSEIADLKNIGQPGKAGALVAGLFLQEFVGDIPWAHLDVAGPARAEADDGYVKRGATGVGVRTLVELLTGFESLD